MWRKVSEPSTWGFGVVIEEWQHSVAMFGDCHPVSCCREGKEGKGNGKEGGRAAGWAVGGFLKGANSCMTEAPRAATTASTTHEATRGSICRESLTCPHCNTHSRQRTEYTVCWHHAGKEGLRGEPSLRATQRWLGKLPQTFQSATL